MKRAIRVYKPGTFRDIEITVPADFDLQNEAGKKFFIDRAPETQAMIAAGFSTTYAYQEYPRSLYRGTETVTVNNDAEKAEAAEQGFGEKCEVDTSLVGKVLKKATPRVPDPLEIEFEKKTGVKAFWKGKETKPFQEWVKNQLEKSNAEKGK
jgi:hypothetical protein